MTTLSPRLLPARLRREAFFRAFYQLPVPLTQPPVGLLDWGRVGDPRGC